MYTGNNKLEITKWTNELDDQSVLRQLKNLNDRFSSVHEVWWDTFSVDVSQIKAKESDVSGKRKLATHPENQNGFEKWF